MKNQTHWLAKFLSASVALLLPLAASAVGLAVRPPELNLVADMGGQTTVALTVENPSREVALIEIYTDELEKIVKVSPASFLLESGDKQRVEISVKPAEAGMFRTNISVVANPLSEIGFRASGGVKIPLVIQASSENPNIPLLAAAWLFGSRTSVFNRLFFLYAAAGLTFLGIRYWQLRQKDGRFIPIPSDGSSLNG